MPNDMDLKQKQFNAAMELYETKPVYQNFGKMISAMNVSLQIVLAFMVFPLELGVFWHIVSFIAAYLLADFINGLVHMYMDNSENYRSIPGPLIAAFHLHHKTPVYKKNPVCIVYFNESGSKIWLCIFEIIFVISIAAVPIKAFTAYTFFYFCVLSCVAELSHYFCHISNSKFIDFLQKTGLLLNKKHHGIHHIKDNINYAFLNGVSDPLINIIARKFYSGYKTTTDKHYKYYRGNGTKNR